MPSRLELSMKHIIQTLLFAALFVATTLAVDDPEIVKLRQYAESAAIVAPVSTEPRGDHTRFKIVEFWKRQAGGADLTKYFADGYLPVKFPGELHVGQQIIVFYNLPTSDWQDI